MTTRRDFLWKTASSAVLLAGGFPAFSATKKTLLILGGTRFLGPEIVDAAKASGWTITLFNRGQTNPGLFPELEKLQGDRNGDLKALCEKAAEAAMPGRVTNVRPGLIAGPSDGTDRFTYWPVRVARGGEVLAPDKPEDLVQFIDVRDLAAWIVKTIDTKTMGVFNATSAPLRMGEVLDACKAAGGGDARFTWVEAAFLTAQKVEEWSDLPVWTSPAGSDAGAGRVSNARAVAKGLAFRPVKATAKDTLDWWKTLPKERTSRLKSGLSPEREAEVLAAWHEAQAKKPPKAG